MNETYTIYIISFFIFVGVLTLVEGLYLLWRSLHVEETVKLSRRLKTLSAGGQHGKDALSIIRQREMSDIPFLNRVLMAIPRMQVLDRLLEQAGLELSVSRFLAIQFGAVIGVFLLLYFASPAKPLISFGIAVVVGLGGPYLVAARKKDARHALFAQQIPDTLDFIARSLRAGNPFLASLKGVSEEMPEPTASEFSITFDEINYGLSTEDALANLAKRSGSEEVNFFITAVLIQKTTGGNLADVLNRIAAVMRSRANTHREIRILAGEMQMSARVLIAMPFAVAGSLMVTSPGYLSVLFESTLGIMVVVGQVVLMGVGYYIVHKMVNFRV